MKNTIFPKYPVICNSNCFVFSTIYDHTITDLHTERIPGLRQQELVHTPTSGRNRGRSLATAKPSRRIRGWPQQTTRICRRRAKQENEICALLTFCLNTGCSIIPLGL